MRTYQPQLGLSETEMIMWKSPFHPPLPDLREFILMHTLQSMKLCYDDLPTEDPLPPKWEFMFLMMFHSRGPFPAKVWSYEYVGFPAEVMDM